MVPAKSELSAIANEVVQLHNKCTTAATDALRHAIDAGDALGRAKDRVPYGEWESWLAANVPFGKSTAAAYMRVAERRHLIPAGPLSLSQAVRFLSDTRTTPTPELTPADVDAYHKVRNACNEIRDQQLYLGEHETFDAYLTATLGIGEEEFDRLALTAELPADL